MAAINDGFLSEYENYVDSIIAPLEQHVKSELRRWREDGFWAAYAPFERAAVPRPTQRVRTRVKRIEKVADKIKRLPGTFPDGQTGESLRLMGDVLGARAVVYFPRQLAMLDRELRKEKQFELVDGRSPKAYMSREALDRIGLSADAFEQRGQKPSGYSSLHYTLVVPRASGLAFAGVPFELQTRTMLEETWSEIEHQLGYKPDRHTEFSVRRQFRVIGDHLRAVDLHFDFLYDHLSFRQQQSEPEADDLLNAENVPGVLSELGLSCEQGAIGFLLDILEVNAITTVGQLLDAAQFELIDAVRQEFEREANGRAPSATDVIPVIAALPSGANAENATRALRHHLRMVEMTKQQRRAAESG